MESLEAEQVEEDEQRFPEVFPGWILLGRYETPEETVLRLARRDRPRHAWVTASGPTFEDALTIGVQRVALFDEIDRHWRQRSGPS